MPNANTVVAAFAAVLGIGFIVLAVVIPPSVDRQVDRELEARLVVDSQEHELYQDWLTNQDPEDPPEFYRIWMYNVTNVRAAIDGVEPLQVQEVGPYVYRIVTNRFDVTFGDDVADMSKSEGSLIRYKYQTQYVFQPALSPGLDPAEDRFSNVDLIYKGAIALAGGVGELGVRLLGQRQFFGEDPYEMETFNNLVFDGPQPIFTNQTTIEEARAAVDFDIVRTGSDDYDSRTEYVEWNGLSVVDEWEAPEAVRGRDGLQWPGKLGDGESLVTWQPRLLRAVVLRNEDGERSETEGISLLRHRIAPETFQNQDTNPQNAKYRMTLPNGLIDVSSLNLDVPVSISMPHFLNADPALVQNLVQGLSPDPDLHASFVDVEPRSGATMNARQMAQINVAVGPTPLGYNQMVPAFLPYLTFEYSGAITPKQAKEFKDGVQKAEMIRDSAAIGGPIAASGMFVGSLALLTYRKRKPGVSTAPAKPAVRASRFSSIRLSMPSFFARVNRRTPPPAGTIGSDRQQPLLSPPAHDQTGYGYNGYPAGAHGGYAAPHV